MLPVMLASHLLWTATASAQPTDFPEQPASASRARDQRPSHVPDRAAKQPSYVLSLRPSLGLGLGGVGLGGRLGAAGEYWLSDLLGVGFEAALLGQSQPFGDDSSAAVVAPVVALRSAPRHGYMIFELGAGYARAKRTDGAGFCLDLIGSGCRPANVIRYGGYTVHAALGWLVHPGGSQLELGPVGRLDVVGDFRGRAPVDFVVTLNAELGFAWLN